MEREELEAALAIALPAAREAGAFIRRGFRKHPAVEHKSSAIDLVTSYDKDSEELLRERLAALPYPVIGEESGGAYDASRPVFFVDPLDGTTNFVHGHPFWCVSIGLVDRGAPVLGVVVAPSLGLEWRGYAGGGALRRAIGEARSSFDADEELAPCVPSAVAELTESLLATGFPYDRRTSPDNNFDAFFAIKRKCQAVRRCGSAALDLCLVADGTYEGYWEKKLEPWDLAGGTALVRAAGGRVTDHHGGESFVATGHCVATNGRIHDALLDELARVRARGAPGGGGSGTGGSGGGGGSGGSGGSGGPPGKTA